MYQAPLFRQATFSDMPDVWRIVYHAYSAYIPLLGRTPPTFLEDFDSHVANGNLWLLDNGIEPSAMVVLTPTYDHVMIQALCVDPQQQGRGLGRKTLLFAEQYARSLKMYQLKLYTNSLMLRNLKIYSEWGFKETHREDYSWGERVHMRKHVTRRPKPIKPFGAAALAIA